MNVRTKGTIKKQIAKDAAAEAKRRANKTGEYKEKPKKKVTLKKPSQLTSVKAEPKKEKPVAAVKKVAPKPKAKAKPKAKPAAKKKEAPRTQKGAMAYDGPNKAASEAKDRILAKTKAKREKMKMEHHQKDANGNTIPHEDELNEADKKGKGSGTKDACYKKVKASAKVWPSAYASGRLVQCRKKGAANYGNKSEEVIWDEIFGFYKEAKSEKPAPLPAFK